MLNFYSNPKPRKNKDYWTRTAEMVERGEITKEKCEELRQKHLIKLEKKRKYKRGEPIHTFDELFEVLDKDGFVWMFGRPKTYGFVGSQQVYFLRCMIKRGDVCRAVRK